MRKLLIFSFLCGFSLFSSSQEPPIVPIEKPSTAHEISINLKCIDTFKFVERYDKFEKNTTIRYVGKNITVGKIIDSKSQSDYYLIIVDSNNELTVNQTVKVLLSNEELITRSDGKVKVNPSKGTYLYSAVIFLSNLDLKSMIDFKMTDFKIGSIQFVVPDGEELRQALICLLKK